MTTCSFADRTGSLLLLDVRQDEVERVDPDFPDVVLGVADSLATCDQLGDDGRIGFDGG
jgi:hypothetical protein